MPTLTDIIGELRKPGRDLRDELPPPLMRSGDVMEIKDLKPGMELVGTVRNIIDFGVFVDIGVHEDGLVHISQICSKFIKHPLEAVKVGQVVKVRVLDVDVKRSRISLTMRLNDEEEKKAQQERRPKKKREDRRPRALTQVSSGTAVPASSRSELLCVYSEVRRRMPLHWITTDMQRRLAEHSEGSGRGLSIPGATESNVWRHYGAQQTAALRPGWNGG